jgi:hypothetical protein
VVLKKISMTRTLLTVLSLCLLQVIASTSTDTLAPQTAFTTTREDPITTKSEGPLAALRDSPSNLTPPAQTERLLTVYRELSSVLERFANQEVVIRDPAWAEPFYRLARMSQVLGHQSALEIINQKILYTLEHASFSGTTGTTFDARVQGLIILYMIGQQSAASHELERLAQQLEAGEITAIMDSYHAYYALATAYFVMNRFDRLAAIYPEVERRYRAAEKYLRDFERFPYGLDQFKNVSEGHMEPWYREKPFNLLLFERIVRDQEELDYYQSRTGGTNLITESITDRNALLELIQERTQYFSQLAQELQTSPLSGLEEFFQWLSQHYSELGPSDRKKFSSLLMFLTEEQILGLADHELFTAALEAYVSQWHMMPRGAMEAIGHCVCDRQIPVSLRQRLLNLIPLNQLFETRNQGLRQALLHTYQEDITAFQNPRGAFNPEDPETQIAGYLSILTLEGASVYFSNENYRFSTWLSFCHESSVIDWERRHQAGRDMLRAEDLDEISCLGYEAHVIELETIIPAMERCRDLHVPLVFVENLSYGGVALSPIEEDLQRLAQEMGVELTIIKTKQGSTEAHGNPYVMEPELFSPEQTAYFALREPMVLIFDGSASINGTEGHQPDAAQGFRNYFMLLDAAKGIPVNPEHFRCDLNVEDHEFESARNRIAELMHNVEIPSAPPPYSLHYYSPTRNQLTIRSNRTGMSTGDRMANCDFKTLGPRSVVCVQTAMSSQDIIHRVAHGDRFAMRLLRKIQKPHQGAYFDDQDHFKRFALLLTNRGPVLNQAAGVIARERYLELTREESQEQNTGPQIRGGERNHFHNEILERLRNETHPPVRENGIALVLADLDGSLADSMQNIPDEVLQQLVSLMTSGVHVAIVTMQSMDEILEHVVHPLLDYMRDHDHDSRIVSFLHLFPGAGVMGGNLNIRENYYVFDDDYDYAQDLNMDAASQWKDYVREMLSQPELSGSEFVDRGTQASLHHVPSDQSESLAVNFNQLFEQMGYPVLAYSDGGAIHFILNGVEKSFARDAMLAKLGLNPETDGHRVMALGDNFNGVSPHQDTGLIVSGGRNISLGRPRRGDPAQLEYASSHGWRGAVTYLSLAWGKGTRRGNFALTAGSMQACAIRMNNKNLTKVEHDAMNQAISELITPACQKGTFDELKIYAIPGLLERFKEILVKEKHFPTARAEKAADIVAHVGHREKSIYMDKAVYGELENQPGAIQDVIKHEKAHIEYYKVHQKYAKESKLTEGNEAKERVIQLLRKINEKTIREGRILQKLGSMDISASTRFSRIQTTLQALKEGKTITINDYITRLKSLEVLLGITQRMPGISTFAAHSAYGREFDSLASELIAIKGRAISA